MFIITNTKVKDELYFKDLVFSFLYNDSIPTWANIENFDFNDVVLFIKVIVNKEDRSYLLTLMNEENIKLKIPKIVTSLPEMEKMKFLEIINFSSSSFSLSALIISLKDYFKDTQLSPKHKSNEDFLIDVVLSTSLWNITSLISFIEKRTIIQP